jgi:hypothetical protein
MLKLRGSQPVVGLVMVLGVLWLSACGGHATQTPSPTRTSNSPEASSTLTPTPTPGITRVSYPWPMKATKTSFGSTVYRPADPAVDKEMQFDFLTYWAWSGHQKPSEVLHFVPDSSQISRLATASYASQLQAYVQQEETSGQLVTYVGQQFIQNVTNCTKDGLQCSNLYSFGVTVKTVYSTQTGEVLSKTASSNFIVAVSILQVYSQELELWQAGSIKINEFTQ